VRAIAPIRVAVVGLGVRGRQWADVILAAKDVELAAVVEIHPKGYVEGVPTFSSLAEAATSTRVDGVVLATPPSAHREGIEAAVGLGLPILCEKPLSETLDEAVAMTTVARDAGVPLLVGMNFRYLPVTIELRRRFAEGSLGRPMFASFTYLRNRDGTRPDLNDHPLTMDHPMLLEQSIHHLDLLRHVYAREVETVSATTWNPAASTYAGDACVAIHLVMQGGLHVHYMGTWVSGTNRLEFCWRTDLEGGVVMQRRQFEDLAVAERVPGAERTGPLFDEDTEPLLPVAIPAATPFVDDTATLLDEFAGVVREGRDSGPTAADHLWTLASVHACIVSAAGGRTVDVPDFAADQGIAPA
jgi:predicted dehydrogenase